MADLARLKVILAHTEKYLTKIKGDGRIHLEDQANRLREQISEIQRALPKKKSRKGKR